MRKVLYCRRCSEYFDKKSGQLVFDIRGKPMHFDIKVSESPSWSQSLWNSLDLQASPEKKEVKIQRRRIGSPFFGATIKIFIFLMISYLTPLSSSFLTEEHVNPSERILL